MPVRSEPPVAPPSAGALETRSPAWFRVDASGVVEAAGGELGRYGLAALRPGVPAGEHAPFVDGGAARADGPGLLPRVRMTPDRYADVYTLPAGEETWWLLLDVTAEARDEAVQQQRRYDATLALDEGHRRDFAGVLDALDVLVLREMPNGRYQILGTPPAWAEAWTQERTSLEPTEAWPFIESFLPDAARFCAASGSGTLRSGSWVETMPSGEEVSLEATALRTQQRGCLLLLERLGGRLHEKQSLIQRAREHRLAHESLLRETEKKEVLLHCIVHDLNGPLTAMTGCLDLLASTPQGPDNVQRLSAMGLRQARRQARMIQNILEVYAADLGAMKEEEPEEGLDVVQCAREIAEEYEPAFRRKKVRLDLHVEAASTPRVRADEGRFFRVLANLLDNALRHTPSGATTSLRVQLAGEGADVVVENDGAGVPEDLREALFEKFTRGDEGGGGAGLGLFFCRITLQRWGGSIAYEHREEGGARFRMHLQPMP